jgi:hypothetical protein
LLDNIFSIPYASRPDCARSMSEFATEVISFCANCLDSVRLFAMFGPEQKRIPMRILCEQY